MSKVFSTGLGSHVPVAVTTKSGAVRTLGRSTCGSTPAHTVAGSRTRSTPLLDPISSNGTPHCSRGFVRSYIERAKSANDNWVVCSWEEVAEMATGLLATDGVGLNHACRADALAGHKARADLVIYLQENNLAIPRGRALTKVDADALSQLDFIIGTAIPRVLDVIGDKARGAGLLDVKAESPPRTGHIDWGWVTSTAPVGSWVSDVGGWFDANIAGHPDFAEAPALAVGCCVERIRSNTAQTRCFDADWEAILTRANSSPGVHHGGAWRAVRVHEIPFGPSGSLDEQAMFAAEEFVHAVRDLTALQREWESLPPLPTD